MSIPAAPVGVDPWVRDQIVAAHALAERAEARLKDVETGLAQVKRAIEKQSDDEDVIAAHLLDIKTRLDGFEASFAEIKDAYNRGRSVVRAWRWCVQHKKVLLAVAVFSWIVWGRSLDDIQSRALKAWGAWNAAQGAI